MLKTDSNSSKRLEHALDVISNVKTRSEIRETWNRLLPYGLSSPGLRDCLKTMLPEGHALSGDDISNAMLKLSSSIDPIFYRASVMEQKSI
eukprot:CAMPEP_0185040124 /NCGR_PEP_ID=MMETSP1103-20130426/37825_1 /TAXON_ID=36769 /ORGANISM="Paraphysomonas bandaiensis, Strain Caron Lab Isolate" /LENGTH=90 /DNA_ID=CAMNT_0027579303 /DNA_START=85 /DNA_END=354 /DNA_ORIENTATION=-